MQKRRLGISLYPERSTFEQDVAYLEKAAKLGFDLLFIALLGAGDRQQTIDRYKPLLAKAKERVADGRLEIVEEGTSNKFVDEVQQITYAGAYARPDQKVLYVTERCVMELRDGVMTIVEVAPGVDVNRDIIAHMDFVPAIADDVREMNPALFQEEWDGLKDVLGC